MLAILYNLAPKTLIPALIVGAMVVTGGAARAQVGDAAPCPTLAPGGEAAQPVDIYSSNGVLSVSLNYFTDVDGAGRTQFCFVTPQGWVSPTLHVKPGDTLRINVSNKTPKAPPGSPTERLKDDGCGDPLVTITSVNLHAHGTNTSPACHGDQVVHTVINSGESWQYSLKFPTDEPPGLYWYHPHIHGLSEAAVQGGATGAIIVEGLQNVQSAVAGLPERILIVRDQTIPNGPTPGGLVPSWDLSLNNVPVLYPHYKPAIITMQRGQQELWRVANAAADSILDLQVQYDGKAQPLQVVALDGVPTGSHDGTKSGTALTQTHILLGPANRAEFIVDPPAASIETARLMTLNVPTGPDGDSDPTRPLATIKAGPRASIAGIPVLPAASGAPAALRFEKLAAAPVTAKRALYFSEVISDPSNPASPTNFYITVDGARPALFDANSPPAIVTHQGAVEDWTIENRTGELHFFHIHQIHFQLLAQDGKPLPASEQQFYDTIKVPYWTGKGPYPSVKVRMDFRGLDVGEYVYHCHILGHEDGGMMAIIKVLPQQPA